MADVTKWAFLARDYAAERETTAAPRSDGDAAVRRRRRGPTAGRLRRRRDAATRRGPSAVLAW